MGVNGGSDCGDQLEIVSGDPPKSPWKTSTAASSVMGADSKSWPALSDAQPRPKFNGSIDSDSTKSPPLPTQAKSDACGDPPATPVQAIVEQQKFHGRGNFKSPGRAYTTNQNKTNPKNGPNSIPQFAAPLPYHPPPFTPVFHTMVPISPTSGPGYGYQLSPRAFMRADAQLTKSGSDAAQAFAPPVNGSYQHSPRANSSAHDSGSVGRRHSTNEGYSQMNPPWNNQRPVTSNNFHLLQTTGQIPFMRPPFVGPTGFVDGPNYQDIHATL